MHCNWGWGGSSNGYFSINSMNGFTEDQGAIINILPGGLEIPVALFEYEVYNLEVSFNDLSEVINLQELDTWFWDFGDGISATTQNPTHTYNIAGNYDVSLTSSILGCADTFSISKYIQVIEPTAFFTEVYNCPDPLKVDFTNLSS